MANYAIYKENGQIVTAGCCHDSLLSSMTIPKGFRLIEGIADPEKNMIYEGQIVDIPVRPSGEYDFDYTQRQWVINIERASLLAKKQRDGRLKAVDKINPIWWASMPDEIQQKWIEYRQALLDVPQQPGFPVNIDWPTEPS